MWKEEVVECTGLSQQASQVSKEGVAPQRHITLKKPKQANQNCVTTTTTTKSLQTLPFPSPPLNNHALRKITSSTQPTPAISIHPIWGRVYFTSVSPDISGSNRMARINAGFQRVARWNQPRTREIEERITNYSLLARLLLNVIILMAGQLLPSDKSKVGLGNTSLLFPVNETFYYVTSDKK